MRIKDPKDALESLLSDTKQRFMNAAAIGASNEMSPTIAVESVIAEVKANPALNAVLGSLFEKGKTLTDELKRNAESTISSIGMKNIRYASDAYQTINKDANTINKYRELMDADAKSNLQKLESEISADSTKEQKAEYLEALVNQKLYAANETLVNEIVRELQNPDVIQETAQMLKREVKKNENTEKSLTTFMEKALANAGQEENTDSAKQSNYSYARDALSQVTNTQIRDVRANAEALENKKDRLYSIVQGNAQMKAYDNIVQVIETKATQNLQTINATAQFKAQITEKKTVVSRSSSRTPSRRSSDTGDNLRVQAIKAAASQAQISADKEPVSPSPDRTSWRRASRSSVEFPNPRNPSTPENLAKNVAAENAEKVEKTQADQSKTNK